LKRITFLGTLGCFTVAKVFSVALEVIFNIGNIQFESDAVRTTRLMTSTFQTAMMQINIFSLNTRIVIRHEAQMTPTSRSATI
jgi:hypothetical protein